MVRLILQICLLDCCSNLSLFYPQLGFWGVFPLCGSQMSHIFELNVCRIQDSSILILFFPGFPSQFLGALVTLHPAHCFFRPENLDIFYQRFSGSVHCGSRRALRPKTATNRQFIQFHSSRILSVDSSPESTYVWSFSKAFRCLFVYIVFQSIVYSCSMQKDWSDRRFFSQCQKQDQNFLGKNSWKIWCGEVQS